MKFEISIDKAAMNKIDAELAAIETNLRGQAISNGLRKIGAEIGQKTKSALPKPGYERRTRPGGLLYKDKDGPKPLGQTVRTKLLKYADGVIQVALIGYEYPAGAHGHLVEMGHDLVKGGSKKSGGTVIGHVEPAHYMVTVVENSRAHQDSIMIAAARKLLR